jgi:hypothetical protein
MGAYTQSLRAYRRAGNILLRLPHGRGPVGSVRGMWAKIRENLRSRGSTHVFRKVDKATVSPKARRTAIKNS